MRTPEDRIFSAIVEARAEAGLGPLERRAALDAAAEARATRSARGPAAARVSSDRPLADDLEDAGLRAWSRGVERRITLRGMDPVEGVLSQWSGLRSAWERVLDPDYDAIGLAHAYASDGEMVFVGILLVDSAIPEDLRAVESEIADRVNRIRTDRGLPALLYSPALARVARDHSADMAKRGYFEHVAPDGRAPADRVRAAAIEYALVAENLAYNHREADPIESAVKDWMASPGHRANILSGEVSRTGVGVVVAADGGIYFTQLFLEPR